MSGKHQDRKITPLGVTIWVICALFFLYEFFLRTFLGALAKQIMPDLNLAPSLFALLASAFYVAYGLMQVPAGILGDRFGVKNCLLFATVVCAIASFCFASTHSFIPALIYRFMMGFGGGFAFIILLIATISWFPKSKLAFFVGMGQFIGTMGALIASGPLAALVSSIDVSWRVVFLFIGAFGIVLFLLALFFVKERKKAGEAQMVYIEKEISLSRKLKQIFKSRQSYYIACYSAFVFLSVAMLGAVWGTLYLESLGFSQKVAASIVSFGWLGFAVGCPLLGYLSDRFVTRKIIMVICPAVGLALICLLVYLPLNSFALYALLFFFLGITSSGQSIGFAAITEHVQPHLKSIALGLNSAFITLLAAITPVIVGSIVQAVATKTSTLGQYKPSDFTLAFSLMPILYLAALILSSFFIEETYCRSKKEVIYINL